MKTIYLFDLYDTMLKDVSFDFQRGMRYLYETCFADRCTWEQFLEYENTFYPLYEKRKIDNSEVNLMRDEVVPIFSQFDVPLPADPEELEFQIMDHMQEETLLPAVGETLKTLHERGCPMYILSNAVFSAKSARRLLDRFGIGQYFKRIYSSADCGTRKPGRKFFDLAVSEILEENRGAVREDILYVGNDYLTDVTGGTLAGLTTVWYNEKHLANTGQLTVREIADFRELLEEAT